MRTSFWLTTDNCKKNPTTNKETPPDGEELFMINARSKCPKVSLSIIDISSIAHGGVKDLKDHRKLSEYLNHCCRICTYFLPIKNVEGRIVLPAFDPV